MDTKVFFSFVRLFTFGKVDREQSSLKESFPRKTRIVRRFYVSNLEEFSFYRIKGNTLIIRVMMLSN